MTKPDQDRADFEAWMRREHPHCSLVQGPDGKYGWVVARLQWASWQGSHEHARAQGEPAAAAAAVEDLWFTDRALPILAISGDADSAAVIKLVFRRPVTNADRDDVIAALNAHLAATISPPAGSGEVERLEEAVRLAEVGEYLFNACRYSGGDGYTEPREMGIEWQWQQSAPDQYGEGMLLAAATKWHDEQAEDGTVTEARKLRESLAACFTAPPPEPAKAEVVAYLIIAPNAERDLSFIDIVAGDRNHGYTSSPLYSTPPTAPAAARSAAEEMRERCAKLVRELHVWQGSNDLADARTKEWLEAGILAIPLPGEEA